MKILIDCHMLGFREGGNERYTKNLVMFLSKLCPLGVILYKKGVGIKGVKKYFVPHSDIFRLFFIPFILIFHHFDILHTNYILPFFKPKGKKYVITVHDVYFKRAPQSYNLKDRFLFSFLFPYSLWLSDAIIVPSSFTRKEFIHFFPQYAYKVTITREGVDPLFITPLKRKKNPKFFLCISSKSSRKNTKQITSSFANAGLMNTYLYIIGGKKGENCQEGKNIKHLGYVSDSRLKRLYTNAIALIYMSSYEGFGLPIIEALASNTQVIASDTPCHREVGREMIVYVKPQNNDLINKIRRARYQTKNTRANTLHLFDWKKTANATFSLYQLLMTKR